MDEYNRFEGILVVVPTRNRPRLARNAITSVMRQRYCDDIHVLVSDNSSSPEARRDLRAFCEEQDYYGKRLRYMETPSSLPMSWHWEWALRIALAEYDVNHFSFLTDRMIFKDNHLEEIRGLAISFPDDAISYDHDKIDDYTSTVTIEQAEWTGKVLAVESARLLATVSQAHFYSALPRMLNCVVPRTALRNVVESFGTVFDSISPDFNFCFKLLSCVHQIIYLDKAPLIHYALDRSNGASYVRGVPSEDSVDFKRLSSDDWDASPFPEIRTIGNAILHEYCSVRQSESGSRMPPVNENAYLDLFLAQAHDIIEPRLRARTVQLVRSYRQELKATPSNSTEPAKQDVPSAVVKERDTAAKTVAGSIAGGTTTNSERFMSRSSIVVRCYRYARNQYWIYRALYFGHPAPDLSSLFFTSTEQALRFLSRCSRPKVETNNQTIEMLGGNVLNVSSGRRR